MVIIRTQEEIEKIRQGGKILAKILKDLKQRTIVGISAKELDNLTFEQMKEAGVRPAFLHYRPSGAIKPFPASICVSINSEIAHGIPLANKIIKQGDLITLDAGVVYQSYYSDSAISFCVGEENREKNKLLKFTKLALLKAIQVARKGKRLGDIGWAIEKTIKQAGFSVIRGLTGHSIGKELHEGIDVYNYGQRNTGIELKPGMALAIEPMAAAGSGDIIQKPDGTFITRDGSLSAHFEHTIVIKSFGPAEILTK